MDQDSTSPASSFCNTCGSALSSGGVCVRCSPPTPPEPDLSQADVEEMLHAAADSCLLRKYSDAKAIYQAVLRQHHDNVDALVGIGDVCLAEGQPEDAAKWYRFALDSDPANKAAADKLSSLAGFVAASAVPSSRQLTSNSAGGAQDRLQLALRVTFGIGVLIVILAVISFALRGPRRVQEAVRQQPTASSAATGTRQAPQESGATGRAAADVEQTDVYEEPQPGAAQVPVAQTEQERAFASRLASLPTMTGIAAKVQAVEADPRTNGIVITAGFGGQRVPSRIEILQNARAIARAAYSIEAAAQVVTVRMNAPLPQTGILVQEQVAFVGDMYRISATADPGADASAETLEGLFANVYWDFRLRGVPQRPAQQQSR